MPATSGISSHSSRMSTELVHRRKYHYLWSNTIIAIEILCWTTGALQSPIHLISYVTAAHRRLCTKFKQYHWPSTDCCICFKTRQDDTGRPASQQCRSKDLLTFFFWISVQHRTLHYVHYGKYIWILIFCQSIRQFRVISPRPSPSQLRPKFSDDFGSAEATTTIVNASM